MKSKKLCKHINALIERLHEDHARDLKEWADLYIKTGFFLSELTLNAWSGLFVNLGRAAEAAASKNLDGTRHWLREAGDCERFLNGNRDQTDAILKEHAGCQI